ncbi:MAG: putative Ig domain-containing protein [Verrucomicrobia bacterium]|nr:putative Ig domain-containing protein [Verrucomicrobiota bacterium]
MNRLLILAASIASFGMPLFAATINWSETNNHGLSLANGSEVPVGSLVRLGWFRNATTDTQLTVSEIQAIASNPTNLNSNFVEAASSTIGTGFTGSVAGHFAAASSADTGSTGLNLEGKQMFLWILNAASLGAASQQAIISWDVTDTTTNPDGTPDTPGTRWKFPVQNPPGVTTVDLTDLTTGTSSLAAGARVIVGTFPTGTSTTTSNTNFGLVEIASVPSITSTLPGAVLSTSYSQTFAATGGTGPYTYIVSGGALPDGLTLSTEGLLSGTPTSAGSFTFSIQAQDTLMVNGTRSYTFIVASTALAITTSATLPAGTQGGAYSQALAGSGGTAGYTWSVTSGSLPGGISLSSAGVLSGTPSAPSSSSFTVRLADSGGLTSSLTMSLQIQASPIVIQNAATMPEAVVGIDIGQSFTASGGTAPYTWTLATGITLGTTGVLTGKPTAAGTSTFTVRVTDAASLTLTKAMTITVQATLALPVVTPPNFANTAVSASFSHTLSASFYPRSFTVSGLPTGLTLDTTKRIIQGKPTTSGTYTVRISATNAKGTGATISATLRVQALTTNAVGTFLGILARENIVTGGLGGRIDLTTATTGSFTAKVLIGSTTYSTTSSLTTAINAFPQVITTISRGTKLPALRLALTINTTTNTLTGTVSATVNNISRDTTVDGWRQTWNTLTNPASDQAGYYTAGLDLSASNTQIITGDNIPQGTGYVAFTIATDGKLTVAGKTADNSTITTAGFMGPTGQIAVHQALYTNLGSVVGKMSLATDPDGLFYENIITGSLSWTKPLNTKVFTYAAGFTDLKLDAYGKYMAANTKGIVLGLPDTGAFALSFSEGGLSQFLQNPSIPNANFTEALKPVLPTNPTKTTLTISTTTGVVTGGFTLVNGTLTRATKFYGAIIRTPAGTTRALGFFLLKQIPTGLETSATARELSGQMIIDDL